MTPRQQLLDIFLAAVAAAQAEHCVPPHLPSPPKGRTVVVGAGKAAAAMARAVEENWPGPLQGVVVTRDGYGVACERIEMIEASHPVPDARGRAAAGRVLQAVQGLTADDMVLCLVSGGASALLTLPAEGMTLADKQAVNRALLRCGAAIGEINTVRKHLSAIKGGRLAAAAHPASVVTLLISDVPGDDPATIGSGPTVPDPTRYADARAVIAKYGIDVPASVRARLEAGLDETPKPGDPRLARASATIIATPRQALEAATAKAHAFGYEPVVLGDRIEGEAREVGREHARMALDLAKKGGKPRAILSGGELTVTIRGEGRGGPNAEYMMAMALALNGAPGIHALAGDTDGIDGSEDNAGGLIAPDTLARARAKGLDIAAMLDVNDSYEFFRALGDLVMTGPTFTNVNDLRVILIGNGSP
ncbi:MAG: glycerate kinase type-2 family protein [Alphaproteobacteria bacterium]